VTGDRAERALTTALGLWRATSGRAEIGRDGWTFRNANLILELAFALAGERGDLFERVRKDIPDCIPIDLRVNGKGQFILYWKRPEISQPTFLAAFADVFVMRGMLRIRRDRVEINGEPTMTYAHNPGFTSAGWSGEPKGFRHLVREVSIAREDNLLSRATSANLPGWVAADEASHIVDVVSFDASKAFEELDLDHTENEISRRVLNVVVHKGNVNRTQVVVPLGIVQWSDHVSIIALECTGLDFLAALGEKSLALAEGLVRRRFEEKVENVADLRKRAAAAAEKGLIPMNLVTTRRWAALTPGINILNDGEASGSHISIKGSYHSGFSGALYETIDEAILKEMQKSLRDAVRIHFLNEGSRKLAETYFNARKPT
jgi:hypothetical protein